MNKFTPAMLDQITGFCDSYAEAYEQHAENPEKIKELTCAALAGLTKNYTTGEYTFNYALEIFTEQYYADIAPVLPSILSESLPSRKARITVKTNIAFAAYYALSLIYKKERNLEGLKTLLSEKYTPLCSLYPLAYEVKSRCHKRFGDYEEALECDDAAITILKGQHIINYGLYISYASTVCMMFDTGCLVSKTQAERAKEYIEEAISSNPEYPKYHYLKGKLLYYSNLNTPDTEAFLAIAKKAIASIETAQQKLFVKGGAHMEHERKSYFKLIRQIQLEMSHRQEEDASLSAFRDMSSHEVKDAKNRILACSRPADCKPPRPALKPGEKYFFICYCTEDFQSVFCDLVEMYSLKIPFQYDETLTHGKDWHSQVRSYISSENCAGVIFYISRHSITSAAFAWETNLVVNEFQGHKPYFCVNLEGEAPPSTHLIKAIQSTTAEKLQACGVNSDRICGFLQAFPDGGVFTPKSPQEDAASSSHFQGLIQAIRRTFPSISLTAVSSADLFSKV